MCRKPEFSNLGKAAKEAGAWSALCPQEGSGPFLSLCLLIGISKGGSAGGGRSWEGPLLLPPPGPLTFQRAPRRKWQKRRATSVSSLWMTSCLL